MIAAIIQARMGSTRLPGKTMANLSDKPMLQHVIERVRASYLVDEVIIATTTQTNDDSLAEFTEGSGLKCFRGSEEDVLDRVYQTARHHSVEHIIRVTPDCPLLDPDVVDRVIDVYQSNQYDYVSNTMRYTFPEGLDVEVFSFPALEQAWKEARTPSEREHVTTYIRNSGQFNLFNVVHSSNLSHLKWSVDTKEDFAFVEAVYKYLPDGNESYQFNRVLQVLREHPELTAINQGSVVNVGYYKSLVNDPPVPPNDIHFDRSFALKSKAQELIPSVAQTFSKSPTQFIQGAAPIFLQRGQGSHVWDVDGNEYIDWIMGLGPVILGHDYPSVTDAVKHQMRDGISFSLPHPLEIEVAESLTEIIPCAEMVRFGKNGSDATSGAVRVARAYTGREIIACCGYHGWQDWFIGTTTRSRGVPQAVQELTVPFQYNDISSLERIFAAKPGKVAAVIMEPVGVVDPTDEFLQKVKDLAHREGALFIFDEVITGFRLALGGAQEHYGVTPDLAAVGKAMGNGFPISAIVGRREIMELFDEIFFSFTFGGEAASLAATMATIREMREKDVIDHLWAQGQKLKDGYNTLAHEFGVDRYTECIGLAPHTVSVFKDETGAESLELKSLFQQECLKRGLLFSVGHNTCYSHSDLDVDHTLQVHRTALEIFSQAIREGDILERLEGKPVEPVFRKA